MKYQVIRAPHLHELEEKVNELTAEEWEPQGGITVAGNVMMQAMVKDEDDE